MDLSSPTPPEVHTLEDARAVIGALWEIARGVTALQQRVESLEVENAALKVRVQELEAENASL